MMLDDLGLLAKPSKGQWCDELDEPCPEKCDKPGLQEALTEASRWQTRYCEASRTGTSVRPGEGVDAIGGIDDNRAWYMPQGDEDNPRPCREWCICVHENKHLQDLADPRLEQFLINAGVDAAANKLECRAYGASIGCLVGFIQAPPPE